MKHEEYKNIIKRIENIEKMLDFFKKSLNEIKIELQLQQLSKTERLILEGILAKRSMQEIEESLKISRNQCNVHVSRIKKKINITKLLYNVRRSTDIKVSDFTDSEK